MSLLVLPRVITRTRPRAGARSIQWLPGATGLLMTCVLTIAVTATAARAQNTPADSLNSWFDQAATLNSQRRWVGLDSLAAIIIDRAEKVAAPDSARMALALYYRGHARWAAGLFKDTIGEQCLLRSLDLHGRLAQPDTAHWAMTHQALARLLTETDRADSALIVAARGRALCPPTLAGGDSLNAFLWVATGRAYRRLNQFDRAIAAYDSAMVLRETRYGREHPLVAESMAEIGAMHGRAYRLNEARRLLDEAVAIFERTSGPNSSALIVPLSDLSFVESASGNIARSIEILERAAAIIASVHGPNSPRLVPQIYNIALRLSDFGDYEGAYAVAAALLPRAEASLGAGNSRTETVRYLAGAMAMMWGDTAAAARHLIPAREYLLSKSIDAAHISNLIERFYSMLLARRGDLTGARRVVGEGLDRELKSGQPLAPVLYPLLDQLTAVQMALFDSTGLDATLLVLDEHFGEGSGKETFGDRYLRTRARCELWRGRRNVAAMFAIMSEELERQRLLKNVRALPDTRSLQLADEGSEGLEILVRLSGDGDSALVAAWDRVIRRRGLVTSELAAYRAPHVIAGADTALVNAHARWIEALRASARLEVTGAGQPEVLNESRAAAENAERRYGAMAAAHGVTRDTTSIDLARVRSELDPDEALVSIVRVTAVNDAARYIAFATVGPRGKLSRIDLGPAGDLSGPISAWRAAIGVPPDAPGGRNEAACRKLGLDVRALTWDRLAPAIAGADRVILVADGELADLPWQALPGSADHYLVEEPVEIQTPAAERELLENTDGGGRGLLALGDPDYSRSEDWWPEPPAADAPVTAGGDTARSAAEDIAMLLRGAGPDCGAANAIALEPLPGARSEVEEIARAWNATHDGDPATLLIGSEGSERAFKESAPGRSVLHLATHGILLGRDCSPVFEGTRGVGGVGPIEPEKKGTARPPSLAVVKTPPVLKAELPPSPWNGRRVWLALAGANRGKSGGDENDGLLTADEVVTLDLSGVDWVVLSACQSGIGQNWPLEGSVGIRRAFRLAGAGAVIASQWSIADESTREWMRALYSARAAGRNTAAAAMRTASRSVLEARRAGGRNTHPFYWAAFTATGR